MSSQDRGDEGPLGRCPYCNARLSTVFVCPCTYTRERLLDAENRERRAAALGASFSQSVQDTLEALDLYKERQRAAEPCPDCGWSERTHVFDHAYYHGVRRV